MDIIWALQTKSRCMNEMLMRGFILELFIFYRHMWMDICVCKSMWCDGMCARHCQPEPEWMVAEHRMCVSLRVWVNVSARQFFMDFYYPRDTQKTQPAINIHELRIPFNGFKQWASCSLRESLTHFNLALSLSTMFRLPPVFSSKIFDE